MMDGVQLFPFSEYWWFYALFTVFIVGLPATDLGLFHRDRPFPHVEVRTGGDSDFIGVKMLWLNDRFQGKFPIGISLGIIAGVLAAALVGSILWPPRDSARTTSRGTPTAAA
jgi:hypothetical protein